MKTLIELYGDLVTEAPPAMSDIYFKAAFPENIEKEAKRLRRLSEDIYEDFLKEWEKRIRHELSTEINEGSSPHTILKLVHYLTIDEMKELMRLTDEYLPSTNEAFMVLKTRELESYVVQCAQQAAEIFKELYREYQEKMQKGKIKSVPRIIQP